MLLFAGRVHKPFLGSRRTSQPGVWTMGSLVVNIHYGGVRGWVVLFRHGCRKLPFTCWRRRFFTFYGFPVLVCGKATPCPIAPAHPALQPANSQNKKSQISDFTSDDYRYSMKRPDFSDDISGTQQVMDSFFGAPSMHTALVSYLAIHKA